MVYIVFYIYFDFAEHWKNIDKVFANKDDAEYYILELEENNKDEQVHWELETWELS